MAEKYSFIVVKYPQVDTASAALGVLKELSKDKAVKLKDAVSITKTEKGKIKLHQTRDDSAGKGFVKGGLIGIVFAALFGPAGWIAAGALTGTAFAMFDRGIKNKLLKELGENMTPTESALAVLVEHADWATVFERMQSHNFQGEIVVSELLEEDLAEWEKLTEDEEVVASVPEEVEVRRTKRLEYIEGVGGAYSQKLGEAGITTVEALLEKGSTPAGRKKIADTTGISEKLIVRWVNMADLYRIRGIGGEYAELLGAAEVNNVPELAQRVPTDLLAKMVAANELRKLVRRVPVLSQVESWVVQAKSLPLVVSY